jgi:serine/threonine protein kinase
MELKNNDLNGKTIHDNTTLFLTNHECFTLGNYYVDKKKIGIGSFATIYHGIEKTLGKEVAVKRLHVKDINDIKKLSPHVNTEIEIMKELKHPNIIRMFDIIYESDYDNINIIMEYAPLGNLADLKKIKVIVGEIYSKFYMRQIADGLKYLLSKNIMHRDLKPQNILIFPCDIIKLADFGLAKNFHDDQKFKTLCGSPIYMAPEILIPNSSNNSSSFDKKQRSYTIKADLWSLGIILFELVTGKFPINAKTLYHLPQQIKDFQLIFPIESILTNQCRDLISRLLIKEPKIRIEWEQFFNHIWFKTDEITEQKNVENAKINDLIEIADNQISEHNINTCNKIEERSISLPGKLVSNFNIQPEKNFNVHSIKKLEKLNFELSSSQLSNDSDTKKINSKSKENKDEKKNEKNFKEGKKESKLESKLDLIIGQLNELKTIQHENKKLKARIRQLSHNEHLDDDVDLNFDNIIEGSKNSNHSDSTDSESSNEDFIDIINSKNDSKNDKFVVIKSKPINIENEFIYNNSPSNDNKTRIKEQFKHYFNTSINLLKESANYLSGNYKSI